MSKVLTNKKAKKLAKKFNKMYDEDVMLFVIYLMENHRKRAKYIRSIFNVARKSYKEYP